MGRQGYCMGEDHSKACTALQMERRKFCRHQCDVQAQQDDKALVKSHSSGLIVIRKAPRGCAAGYTKHLKKGAAGQWRVMHVDLDRCWS